MKVTILVAVLMAVFYAGMLVGSIKTIAKYDIDKDSIRAKLERELEAYHLCIKTSGSTGCQMTPEDFINYYDLKYRILQLEEK